ncbi:hypothetical protein D3C75_961840 [compost metagenome]
MFLSSSYIRPRAHACAVSGAAHIGRVSLLVMTEAGRTGWKLVELARKNAPGRFRRRFKRSQGAKFSPGTSVGRTRHPKTEAPTFEGDAANSLKQRAAARRALATFAALKQRATASRA